MLPARTANPAISQPQNRCLKGARISSIRTQGFAKTFTGSFLVGPPDELIGPFEDPRTRPMENAFAISRPGPVDPQLGGVRQLPHRALPVMQDGKIIGHTYEQTTYPEWAFSAYRTGETPQGGFPSKAPSGAGALAESCQSCHMPSKDASGKPYRSKIAGIQEHSNFPETEYALASTDLDLPVREGFARHTLVGLNVFLVKMAQQFPDVLGIRTQDPMLVSKGLDPLLFTEQAMLDQASQSTARIAVSKVESRDGKLTARVRVDSDVGHKFPSGWDSAAPSWSFPCWTAPAMSSGFGAHQRRGRDRGRERSSCRGELWWEDDCSARLHPDKLGLPAAFRGDRRQDRRRSTRSW